MGVTPVVFVHGYGGAGPEGAAVLAATGGGRWWRWPWWDPHPWRASRRFGDLCRRITADTGRAPVVVAHSAGGVVASLAVLDGAPVDTLVCLGSPLGGLAVTVPVGFAGHLRRTGRPVRRIRETPWPARVGLVTVAGLLDTVVPDAGHPGGVGTHLRVLCGHMGLLTHPRVLGLVAGLARGGTAGSGAPRPGPVTVPAVGPATGGGGMTVRTAAPTAWGRAPVAA